jgi:UDP-glucose 4-epimerase
MSDQQNWAGKQVLVTGGAGFIGSHLVDLLVAAGAQVTIVDLFTSGRPENLADVAERVTIHEADIREIDWQPLLSATSYDVIFHMAANAYVPPSVENPAFDYETNFASTFRLLDALRKMSWPGALIFASSAAVYGNASRIPIREDDPTVPVSPYGVGKLAAERYLVVFSKLYGLRAAALRLFSGYGPRQRKQVVYDLIEKITRNPDELFIHGDGTQVRDLVYVTDIARAAMLVAARGDLTGAVYNVGTGADCTIHHMAETLCQILGAQPRFVYSGSVRPGDPEKLSVDISRLVELGYQPQMSLEDGLRETVRWYQATQQLAQPA